MMERWDLPKGWEWKRLGDFCKTTSGGTPKRNVADYYGGTIPWLKSGELNDGVILQTEETITEKGLNESNAKIFPKGTLLIALYGATVGKLGILGIDSATNQAICAIFPSDDVEKTFLFWFLRAIRQKLLKSSFGGAQPNISQEIIRNLEVPIPYPDDPARSLAEQRRIAARLETLLGETRALREEVQSMRRDLAQVMESALAEAFPAPQGEVAEGWGWKRLGELLTHYDSGIWGNPADSSNGYPVLRSTNIDNWELNLSADIAYRVIPSDRLSRYKLAWGDIIVTKSSGSPRLIGEAALVDIAESSQVYLFSNFLLRLRPNLEFINAKYLHFYLRSSRGREVIEQMHRTTSGLRNLQIQAYISQNIPIPYPDDPARSLDEQRRIVASLERIAEETRALDASLAQDLRDLEALEQSILAAAFRGEV
jgi:type I restriction enzyme S subunit